MKFKSLKSYENLFQDYFQQINTKTFQPITNEIYDIIEIEGLDEEFETNNKKDFSFIELDIPSEDREKLKQFDDTTVEKYNKFDISLKSKFNNFIDLIDYEKGKIKILKIIHRNHK